MDSSNPTLRALGVLSLVGLACTALACNTSDPGGTGTVSDGGTQVTSSPLTEDGGDASESQGEPTTAGAESEGEAGATEGASTGQPVTSTTTDGPGTGSTTEPGTDSGTSDPGTTGDSTTGDDTTGETTNTTDDTTTGADEDCQAPAVQTPCDAGTNDVFKAIGVGCSNDPTSAIPIKNPILKAPDKTSYRVATHYGTAKDPMMPNAWAWGAHEGERLLVIGTGNFPALQADGGLTEPDSDFLSNVDSPNGNPDGLPNLPGIMHYEPGSNNGKGGTPFMGCDGVNDCSDTLDPQWNIEADNVANDAFYMSFDLTVPLGTHGYLVDFAYFSQEWPTFVDSTFNDMFVVWSTSESFTGNVTFIDDQPLTVTALDPYMTVKPGDPLLAGTGFPDTLFDTEGAGTGWFTAKGSAVPGESLTIAIAVFDMGDDILDTIGLIDKFRWDCVGCVPSEVDSCGIIPL